MITNLPAKIEEYTPLQAQASLTEAEKAVFDELSIITHKFNRDKIWAHWAFGKVAAKTHAAAKKSQKLYGNKVLLRLSLALGFSTDRMMRNARDVCAAFVTKKAFEEYVKLRGEANNELTWSHMVHLSGIGDNEKRMELAALTLDRAWSAQTLFERVRDLCERTKRGSNRGKVKIPSSARACMIHVQSQATKFVDNTKEAWTGDAFDLRECLKEIPADKLDGKLLTLMAETVAGVSALVASAEDMETALKDAKKDVEGRIQAQIDLQAQHDADMAAAIDDDVEETPAPASAPRKPAVSGPIRAGRTGVNR